MTTVQKRAGEQGQGMIEFVFLLTLLMTLCAGMLYASRLLTAEFWAQQEARFLAFEADWIGSKTYGGDPGEGAKGVLASSGTVLRRPAVLEGMEPERSVESAGGLSELLASLSGSSLWERVNLFEGDRVGVAFAAKVPALSGGIKSSLPPAPREVRPRRSGVEGEPQFAERISHLLHTVSFGEGACEGMLSAVPEGAFPAMRSKLANPSCASWIDNRFGEHLAREVSIPEWTHRFEHLLNQGYPTGDAAWQVTRQEVARGFYSFFDTVVKNSFTLAEPTLAAGKIEGSLAVANTSYFRMLQKMRYLGSVVALGKVAEQTAQVVGRQVSNRNVAAEKAFEDAVRGVLNAESEWTDYLMTAALPVPPELSPAAGGMFSGLMRMALSQDAGILGDAEALTPVYASNKQSEVSYDVGQGVFPAIRRRFNTENIRLRSRFFLITQPWHIDRRVDGTGDYRELGGQLDTVNDSTDEGVLRRRVAGFWLVPTPANGLVEPFLDVAGLEGVSSLLSTVDVLSGALAVIKELLVENPLNKIFNAIKEIPGFNSLEPPLPEWPAVRPQAYPGSNEIEGDKLMAGSGDGRTFQDYIDEQREFNPEPDPTFGDDD